MSVARCQEINNRLRAAGITVHEAGGWQSRGNGQSSAYEGGIVHHTATGYAMALPGTGVGNLLINGRPDLSGPLCNYAGNDDGTLTVIAAHPANHAGSSGGKSMGPLPVTTLFNRRVLGLEIVYPGTSPMRAAQYRAALVWARVVADVVGGGDIQRVRAHAETSTTGKWDPGNAPGKTIDMAAFRAAAAANAGGNDSMDPNNAHDSALMYRIYEGIAQGKEFREQGAGTEPGKPEPLVFIHDSKANMGRTHAMMRMRPVVEWGPGDVVGEPNLLFEFFQSMRADLLSVKAGVAGLSDDESKILAAISTVQTSVNALADGGLDEAELANLLAPVLAPLVDLGVTEEQVEAAMRRVFASAGGSDPATQG